MPRDHTDDNNGPRIPIHGVAGATIFAALQRMAMCCGDCAITIKKERLAGGGYAYSIGNHEPPARPVTKR